MARFNTVYFGQTVFGTLVYARTLEVSLIAQELFNVKLEAENKMDSFYRGATVPLKFTVRRKEPPYSLLSPSDGCEVDIWGKEGEEMLVGARMSTSTNGIYTYNYTLDKNAPRGIYTARARAIDGSPTTFTSDEYQFRVK